MKNTVKMFGIIAFAALIIFSMTACSNSAGGGGGGGEYSFCSFQTTVTKFETAIGASTAPSDGSTWFIYGEKSALITNVMTAYTNADIDRDGSNSAPLSNVEQEYTNFNSPTNQTQFFNLLSNAGIAVLARTSSSNVDVIAAYKN
jgi:hypothetical protein